MSNPIQKSDQQCHCIDKPVATIEMIIQPRQRDLGGFFVRRLLPVAQKRMVGPWVFFDHMGPAEFAAGDGIDVAPHPHINLATVTYLFEGEILHRDSLGTIQAIRPGDINLMVAGRGIVHSERETPKARQQPRRLHGLQLWLALPVDKEEIEPAFYHYTSSDIPAVDVGGVPVRILMGSAFGKTSPVKTFAQTMYLEARLSQGQELQLPVIPEQAVYAACGKVLVNDTLLETGQMAILKHDQDVTLKADGESQIAIIGGETMQPRLMFWNFISTRAERIEQAKHDWQQGLFDDVIGDDGDRIPLPKG